MSLPDITTKKNFISLFTILSGIFFIEELIYTINGKIYQIDDSFIIFEQHQEILVGLFILSNIINIVIVYVVYEFIAHRNEKSAKIIAWVSIIGMLIQIIAMLFV